MWSGDAVAVEVEDREVGVERRAGDREVVGAALGVAQQVGDVRVVAAGLECRRSGLDEAPRHEHRAPRPRNAVPVGEVAPVAARRLLAVADARDRGVVGSAPELGVLGPPQPPRPHRLERRRERRLLGEEREQVRPAHLVDLLLGEAHPVLRPAHRCGCPLAVHAVERAGVERPVRVVQERALRPPHLRAVHGRRRQMELVNVGDRCHGIGRIVAAAHRAPPTADPFRTVAAASSATGRAASAPRA